MLTYRVGAAGVISAAQFMADYLLELALPKPSVDLARYYTRTTDHDDVGIPCAEIGNNLDPRIVDALRLPSGRGVRRKEIAALLCGLRADGKPVAAKQRQSGVRSLADLLDLDCGTIPEELSLKRIATLLTDDAAAISKSTERKRAARRLFDLYQVPKDYPIDDMLCHRLGGGSDFNGKPIEQRFLLDAILSSRTPIGYLDLTWAADKSVSIAWALAQTDAERAMILQAHRGAVDAAMNYTEKIIGHARKGKGGRGGSDQGHIGWLRFDHDTSRPTVELAETDARTGETSTRLVTLHRSGDPQLHTHCVVPNVVVTDAGRVGGLDTNRLDGRVKELGALYQAFLARNLRQIGVDVVMDRATGAARIMAVPDQIRQAFSKRTQDGSLAARTYARERGLNWESLSTHARVALLKQGTQGNRRQSKSDDMADIASWRTQAAAHGWEVPPFVRLHARKQPPPSEQRLQAAFEVTCEMLAGLFARNAVLEGADARVCAARALVATGIEDASDVDKVISMLTSRPFHQDGSDTVLLWTEDIDASGRTHVRVTTRLNAAREIELIELAHRAASDNTGALHEHQIDAGIVASGLTFDGTHGEAQRRAMSALATRGRLSVLVGVAGAGKTTLLAPLVQAWQAAGCSVWGTAVAWRQAEDMAGAGVDAFRLRATVPLIRSIKSGQVALGRSDVVLLDELSLLSTVQLLDLLRARDTAGFRLAMIGDPLQCQSVEAGPVVDLLRRALGDDAIPTLNVSVRQRTADERQTALMFRGGQTREALQRKFDDETLHLVAGSRTDVISRIADLWRERHVAGRSRSDFSLSVSAPTNADAREIAKAIRERRRELGEIDGDEVIVHAVDQHGTGYEMALASGDRIRLFARINASRPDGSRGIIGNNGSVLTVCAVEAAGLRLRNKLGHDGFVRWDTLADRQTGRIRLGYGDVLTIDASQGLTSSEHIEALPSGSQAVDAHRAYVQGSRHRERTWLVTSENAERQQIAGRRALGDVRPIRQTDIVDNMARNMARRDARLSALALLDRAREVRHDTQHGFQVACLALERRQQQTGCTASLTSMLRRYRVEASEGLLPQISDALTKIRHVSEPDNSSPPVGTPNPYAAIHQAIRVVVGRVRSELATRLRRLRLRKAADQARRRIANDCGKLWRRIERDLLPEEIPVWGTDAYFGPVAQEKMRRFGSISMEEASALHLRDMERKRDARRLTPAGTETATAQVDRLFRLIACTEKGADRGNDTLVLEIPVAGRQKGNQIFDGLAEDLAQMDIIVDGPVRRDGAFRVRRQHLVRALGAFDAPTIRSVCDRLLACVESQTPLRQRRADRPLDTSIGARRSQRQRQRYDPSL